MTPLDISPFRPLWPTSYAFRPLRPVIFTLFRGGPVLLIRHQCYSSLHILFFVVVNWAARIIVCILPSSDVIMLLLCFTLEHSFETIVSIWQHSWWIMMGCFHICVLLATRQGPPVLYGPCSEEQSCRQSHQVILPLISTHEMPTCGRHLGFQHHH